jgi:hypothetical protein
MTRALSAWRSPKSAFKPDRARRFALTPPSAYSSMESCWQTSGAALRNSHSLAVWKRAIEIAAKQGGGIIDVIQVEEEELTVTAII